MAVLGNAAKPDILEEMKKAILFAGAFIFLVGNSTLLWCDTEALVKAIKARDISAAARDFIRKHGQEEISTGELNLLERIIPGTTDFANYIGPRFQFPISTSFLHDSKNPFRYGPDMAFDGDMSTSWVEGVEGNGIGQKLAFVIQGKPERILIVPGYGVEKYFGPNNRLKKAVLTLYRSEREVSQIRERISFESLLSVVLEFEDRLTTQSFPLAIPNLPPGSMGPTEIVGLLEIAEIYQGSKYDDTCIAEIRFERVL